jgi:hypothetical protein
MRKISGGPKGKSYLSEQIGRGIKLYLRERLREDSLNNIFIKRKEIYVRSAAGEMQA